MTTAVEVVRGEVVYSLAENEAIIHQGLRSFLEVGRALQCIRDAQQYREAGFLSFEDYCKERWDFEPQTASQYISAVRVAEVVHARELEPPASEFAARKLARILNEQGENAVAAVWAQILDRHEGEGPVTGREVSRFLRHGQGGNYSGKPGWFELLGEVGDTLIRADKQLAKVEAELRRRPNKAFRDKAGEYAEVAEALATRLREIEEAA